MRLVNSPYPSGKLGRMATSSTRPSALRKSGIGWAATANFVSPVSGSYKPSATVTYLSLGLPAASAASRRVSVAGGPVFGKLKRAEQRYAPPPEHRPQHPLPVPVPA